MIRWAASVRCQGAADAATSPTVADARRGCRRRMTLTCSCGSGTTQLSPITAQGGVCRRRCGRSATPARTLAALLHPPPAASAAAAATLRLCRGAVAEARRFHAAAAMQASELRLRLRRRHVLPTPPLAACARLLGASVSALLRCAAEDGEESTPARLRCRGKPHCAAGQGAQLPADDDDDEPGTRPSGASHFSARHHHHTR
jgi:hypothetical protein